MSQTGGIDRRGEAVAASGAALSLAGAVILALLAIASKNTSSAVWAATFQMVGVVGIWLLGLIQLHQKRLYAEERLEIADLERQRQEKLGGASTIFDDEDLGQMERLAMGRRLRSIERFLIPIVALLVAVFHVAAGLSILPWRYQFPPIADAGAGAIIEPMRLAVFSGAIAFVCFMHSRYALGMSRLKDWGLLCAGGNFMFGASAVCLAACISLFCASNDVRWPEVWVAWAIAILMIAIACETIINFILDFYRPRVPGQAQRPFYDSRLLGMFSEPGGILRSLANAIDYQFGFKVSETWFYRLLGSAVLPLLGFQIVVILALTCFVVVPPGHQAVIERWGVPRPETAKPGIHLTACWPIDRATIVPVARIRRMELGHEVEETNGKKENQYRGPILWTRVHYKHEYKLLVADRAASADTKVPVNLLSMNMPVQWRVKSADAEVIRFHAQSEDVAGILESLAYRELTRYAAGADILDLLGAGGVEASETLQKRIQAACDAAGYDGKGLGVDIVHVGIGGVHPPADQEVASTYEKVVSAIESRDAAIKRAMGEAAERRITSGGTQWRELYDAIVREDEARETDSKDLDRLSREVEQALRTVSGGAAREIVAGAAVRTVERVFGEQSDAERYLLQLAAYEATPGVYAMRAYLRTLSTGLRNVRKYVVVMEDPDKLIYEIDLKPAAAFSALATEVAVREAQEPE